MQTGLGLGANFVVRFLENFVYQQGFDIDGFYWGLIASSVRGVLLWPLDTLRTLQADAVYGEEVGNNKIYILSNYSK